MGDLKIIDELTDNFRNGIYEKSRERKFDITIDVTGLTLADLETGSEISAGNIILLWRIAPQDYLASRKDERGGMRSHEEQVSMKPEKVARVKKESI